MLLCPLSSRLAVMLMTTIAILPGSSATARPGGAPRLDPPSAGHIVLALERLGVVGTVLYVAAHPDDENTRLLAWLANERGLRAAYVSLTRGDGGQNLVGPELGPLLGLIRTYELLAARGVDGAEQYFTRAVDFGYSKSAEETLAIWGKDEILADLTRVVRVVRPDVIINRFSSEPPNHGHHLASAILGSEAFVAAADSTRFPDQLVGQLGVPGMATHQALRLFENKSSWRFKEGEDLSRYLSIDVGGFSPELGRSYTDLAAASRTMHKSQGFGTAPSFGPQPEYFEPTLPERWPAPMPGTTKDPFAGIDFSWARIPGTEALRKHIALAQKTFDPRHPEALLPTLGKVHAALSALPDANPWKATKLAELADLMLACAGLVLDARAPTSVAIPGEPLKITATAVARNSSDVTVAVTWPDGKAADATALKLNTVSTREGAFVPSGPFSTPFWLRAAHPTGLFAPEPSASGILPVGPPDIAVRFTVQLAGTTLFATRPVRYAWVDPVNGERFRAVEILPAVTVTPTAHVRMFPDAAARPLDVRVRAHGAARSGEVRLTLPTGWKSEPAFRPFQLEAEGETVVSFAVTPVGSAAVEIAIQATLTTPTPAPAPAPTPTPPSLDRAEAAIDYLHVPRTTILSPATVRAIPLALKTGGSRIGYIVGAGDEVPAGLTQVGYQVTLLDAASLGSVDLTPFAAVIAGIRSYNVAPGLRNNHAQLMKYVANGGTYLVQYLTSNRQRPLGDVPIGPFPFTVDQGRVTDENAALRIIDPTEPALNTPNRLGPDDYRGWIQERGLYFAATWDPRYKPLFSTNDAGEAPLEGAVIVARHGKGAFVYTGIGFFRQLPEGVPGAYRLLANLLALGAAR